MPRSAKDEGATALRQTHLASAVNRALASHRPTSGSESAATDGSGSDVDDDEYGDDEDEDDEESDEAGGSGADVGGRAPGLGLDAAGSDGERATRDRSHPSANVADGADSRVRSLKITFSENTGAAVAAGAGRKLTRADLIATAEKVQNVADDEDVDDIDIGDSLHDELLHMPDTVDAVRIVHDGTSPPGERWWHPMERVAKAINRRFEVFVVAFADTTGAPVEVVAVRRSGAAAAPAPAASAPVPPGKEAVVTPPEEQVSASVREANVEPVAAAPPEAPAPDAAAPQESPKQEAETDAGRWKPPAEEKVREPSTAFSYSDRRVHAFATSTHTRPSSSSGT